MMVLMVYLADIVDTLSNLLLIGGISGFIASMFFTLILATDFKRGNPALKWIVPLCVVSALVGAALPSKQGVYQMMAAYGAVETVQYLQQSDDAKRIAGKSIQAIEKMLDDALKEDKK